MSNYVRFFSDLSNKDTAQVGGKNASLGEMISKLSPKGIRIPAGIGSKEKKMVYTGSSQKSKATTKNIKTPLKDTKKFVLTNEEIRTLARWSLEIEEHYDMAMDIEWAKDGESGELYIVQARPETVHSSGEKSKIKEYRLKEEGKVLVTGTAIGEKIAKGTARILSSPDESDKLREGDVLITEITNPDWDNVMKKASAIITNSGGRTSHAAIVARELAAVAVVGTENATEVIQDGQKLTVSCAEGQKEKVFYVKLMVQFCRTVEEGKKWSTLWVTLDLSKAGTTWKFM